MPLRDVRFSPGTPERRQLNRVWSKARGPLAVFGLAVLVAIPAWAVGVSWWMDFSEAPAPADFLVVLGGDIARPVAAAELYKTGVAPEVWVARTWKTWGQEEAERLGVPVSSEEDLDKAILVARGVPPAAVRFYGDGVMSTFEEARAFAAEAHPEGKRVLVLTSRFHARRARMIWRSVVTKSELRMIGALDPSFSRRWWRSQPMAYAALTETAKTLYWLAGGRFMKAPR